MPDRLTANRNSQTTEALVSDETQLSTAAILCLVVKDIPSPPGQCGLFQLQQHVKTLYSLM